MSNGELKMALNYKKKTMLFIGFCVAMGHPALNENIIRGKNPKATLMSWIIEHTEIKENLKTNI